VLHSPVYVLPVVSGEALGSVCNSHALNDMAFLICSLTTRSRYSNWCTTTYIFDRTHWTQGPVQRRCCPSLKWWVNRSSDCKETQPLTVMKKSAAKYTVFSIVWQAILSTHITKTFGCYQSITFKEPIHVCPVQPADCFLGKLWHCSYSSCIASRYIWDLKLSKTLPFPTHHFLGATCM
jgi:hypothetical protein